MKPTVRIRRALPLAILLCLQAGAQAPSQPAKASLIFHAGEIVTLDPLEPRAEALAVTDGHITALGELAEVMVMRGPRTRMIDLRGRTLMPSLKDHHLHLLNIGFALLNQKKEGPWLLDLSAARSLEEVSRRVKERAAKAPKGSWILGTGWNQGAWGSGELPTHEALTRAAPENPVYLIRVDGHCGWANAAALRAAGITKSTSDPPGGAIARLADGAPSGILLERANELLLKIVPQPSDEDITEAFRLATHAVAAQGITEVYDAGFLAFPGVVGLNAPLEHYFDLLRKLDEQEPLPLRVNLMIPAPSSLAEKVLRNPKAFAASPRLRVTHVKLFADGALGSRGAALTHPYADDPDTRGVFRMTTEELKANVERALAAGLDVATHAIGDAAVGRVLDVYESILSSTPQLDPGRLRIEHFSYASAADFKRAARLGIILVIQPGFVYPHAAGHTMEGARLGEKNSERAYAWARLQALGARLAGSSDDFSLFPRPLWNFHAAVTRKNPEGRPADGWHPAERLSREASLRLFTGFIPPGGGPAKEPAGRSFSSGQLELGGAAGLVIVTRNPLTANEAEILQTEVAATLLDGRFTFDRGLAGHQNPNR